MTSTTSPMKYRPGDFFASIDCDDNSLTVLWSNGRAVIPAAPKTDVARSLIALILERLP